jgi:hypothetical protein
LAVLSDLAMDPAVLRAIRDEGAVTALREMAAWKFEGHGGSARDLVEAIEKIQ